MARSLQRCLPQRPLQRMGGKMETTVMYQPIKCAIHSDELLVACLVAFAKKASR